MRTPKNLISFLLLLQLLFFTNVFSQFTFVHISDIHVANATSPINSPDIDGAKFKQMLDKINSLVPKPAFVVASGDISNVGSYGNGMYGILTQNLYPQNLTSPQYGDYYIDAAETIPIYIVPGNHDYFSSTLFISSDPGLVNYSANVAPASDFLISYQNAVIFFVLSGYDQFRPIWVDSDLSNPEGSGISNSQCNFLRTNLYQNNNKKKIIVMHHPPVNGVGTNADGSPSTSNIVDALDGSIMNNRDVLLNLCDSAQVDMVLAGHVHQNLVVDRNANIVDENYAGGTRFIQTAASIYGGYRVITVDSSFVWAGEPQLLTFAGLPGYNSDVDDNSFSVTSDPASQTITIHCLSVPSDLDSEIQLMNMAGQEVLSYYETFRSGKQITLSTFTLPKGVYFLSIPKGKIIQGRKILVY
jgi:3',5'-cyclic AMP phosphodiesterase CpdA